MRDTDLQFEMNYTANTDDTLISGIIDASESAPPNLRKV
jgi:hypothetical protein